MLRSDGEDNHSHSNLKQAVERAQRAGVVKLAVDTSYGYQDRHFDLEERSVEVSVALQELAEKTGGTAFPQLDAGSVSKAFKAIPEQTDNM